MKLMAKLEAIGLTVRGKLPRRSGHVVIALDRDRTRWLVIIPRPFGPSWPLLLTQLRAQRLEPNLMTLGEEVLLLVQDSTANREMLSRVESDIHQQQRSQVYVEGAGFLPAKRDSSKMSWIVLFGAATTLIIGVGTFLNSNSNNKNSQAVEASIAPIACAHAMGESEMTAWLAEKLAGLELAQPIVIDSKFGELEVRPTGKLGNSVALAVKLTCEGETHERLYRIDDQFRGQPTLISEID